MRKSFNLLSFDCGNSAIRTILCHYNGNRITYEVLMHEPNDMGLIGKYYYWDILHIFSLLKKGLEIASHKVDKIDSIGICTWGVDFLFLDKHENMLGNVLSYRNTIGAEQLDKLTLDQQKEMFERTGILCDKINSIYMIKGMQEYMPSIMENADKILFVPDILNYFFTGVLENEPSELSTSQLMDARTLQIEKELCHMMGLKDSWFNTIGKHGQKVGNVRKEILGELGIQYDIPVVCVPSHDTASAVFGIPSVDDEFLFVSSGTWALIGAQCNEPIINDMVYDGKFTNEAGAFGRTTLLKNSIGMFILQRLKKEYEREKGVKISWTDFTDLGKKYKEEPYLYDVNHPDFFNPINMAQSINMHIQSNSAQEKGSINKSEEESYDWSKILASTFYSIAHSYVEALKKVKEYTGKEYKTVYIVGGGAKNDIINQYCAEMLQMNITTCVMECAAVGNAASQLAYLDNDITYNRLREIITDSLTVTVW
ncbi:MAG TPA: rhamnulokinase [Clostridiales bacterium]|nr:rhamnulokinase [Clostridiales bacterium]